MKPEQGADPIAVAKQFIEYAALKDSPEASNYLLAAVKWVENYTKEQELEGLKRLQQQEMKLHNSLALADRIAQLKSELKGME